MSLDERTVAAVISYRIKGYHPGWLARFNAVFCAYIEVCTRKKFTHISSLWWNLRPFCERTTVL